MKFMSLTLTTLLALSWSVANAEIEIWKDYKPSEEVYSITTIKVDSNMEEVYLEGIMGSWVSSLEISKDLGHVQSYAIYTSDLPASGDFNMILVVTFANTADLAPNKAKYQKMMAEMTKKKSDEATEYARTNYPSIRTITGEYLFRKIETLK
ncbi:MAG: hypothetical protein ACI854_001774 [Arenicella sp.]|jgi:hypothetical protein